MKATVSVSKTIQETQYEPFQISFTLELEVSSMGELRQVQAELESRLDEAMETRLNKFEEPHEARRPKFRRTKTE